MQIDRETLEHAAREVAAILRTEAEALQTQTRPEPQPRAVDMDAVALRMLAGIIASVETAPPRRSRLAEARRRFVRALTFTPASSPAAR